MLGRCDEVVEMGGDACMMTVDDDAEDATNGDVEVHVVVGWQ